VDQSQEEHLVHVSVSNQSLSQTTADLAVFLGGEQVFHREMRSGTQHTWEETTVSVVRGQQTLVVIESRTGSREEQVVDVDRELWIVITFHSPPEQIRVEIVDGPVGFV
jgi:hypothetical protein